MARANPNDLYEIETLFKEICDHVKKVDKNLKGLFLNADPSLDSEGFLKACKRQYITPNVKPNPRNDSEEKRLEPYENGTHIFNEELYKDRTVIEHSNAWIDGFKALLVRFEFSVRNWVSLQFITFSAIFLRKISKKIKI